MVVCARSQDLSPNRESLEEALRDALKSVLGSAGPGLNPRMEFYDKFQREMEEHDRDFEGRWNEDLNTTLIFVSGDPCAGAGVLRTVYDLMLTAAFRAVWSVLGRDVGVHYRRAIGAQA